MHDLEQAVREEVDRLATLPGSGSDAMLARVYRQRRRNRATTLAALSVIALVAAAAGAVAVLRPTAHPDPATPSPTAAMRLVTLPLQVAFPDGQHGFAIAESCQDHVCQAILATTADGGASWTPHPVTGLTYRVGGQGPPVDLHVLDQRKVALDGDDGRTRWFTGDGGLTWAQLPSAPKGTVAEIAPGTAAWIQEDADSFMDIAVLAPDGTAALLATPPPTKMHSGERDVRVAADGSLWIYGGDDQQTVLWHSRDRGRHWARIVLPGGLAARPYRGGDPVHTEQGSILYTVDGVSGRVWRSTDDGRHWRQLQVRLPARQTDYGLAAVVRFDGSLLLFDTEQGKQYQVTATGTEFTETTGAVLMTRSGIGKRYLRTTGDDPDRLTVLHSADGTSWTELRF
ncbi:WD40/YVTN/BNR-like repeat-containing protein [Catellatospora tritici]|uniref:WD40/YVTN/BNR-like repeat-containing protein n=1 Tax=Catellatospora tritici TaxID=2851566 RepID=UPI001C2CF08A|nr:hypothetical protein [Catellatospora tritici]MBV1856462.1 hypothetical protein [Catellatospora tritici]